MVRLFSGGVFLLAILFAVQSASALDDRPNIVVVLTDDQSMNSLQNMPLLDEIMAQQGITFTNSFVDFSLCSPSRASLLTGKSSRNTGIVGNKASEFGGYSKYKKYEKNSLPVWLKESGYKTGFFGKYMNGYTAGGKENTKNHSQQWSDYHLLKSVDAYNYDVNVNGKLVHKGSAPEDYLTDYLSKAASKFLDENLASNKPLFVMIDTKAPHKPFIPAPRHEDAFPDLEVPRPPNFNEADVSDKPDFAQAAALTESQLDAIQDDYVARQQTLISVEEMVAQVVSDLDAAGELDNTYIIFTSDNGYFSGEHRLISGKGLMYEESIRVPLIIRGPGIPQGETRDQLVNNLDLTATIVDLANIKSGGKLDGHSLESLFADPDAKWRTALYVGGKSFQGESMAVSRDKNRFQAVRTESYIYARHLRSNGSYIHEFYDLSIDPYELENRAKDPLYAEIIKELKQTLNDLVKCSGKSCWTDKPEPVNPAVRVSKSDNKKKSTMAVSASKVRIAAKSQAIKIGAIIHPSGKKLTAASTKGLILHRVVATGRPAVAKSAGRKPSAQTATARSKGPQHASTRAASGPSGQGKAATNSRDAGRKSGDSSTSRSGSGRSGGGSKR